MRVSRWLHRVADAPLPPEIRVLQMINNFVDSEAIFAMVRLGVAEALADGAREVDDLADAVGADPHGLLRLLRVLTHLVLVRRAGSSFTLTREGRTLCREHGASMGPFAVYASSESTRRAWSLLADAVSTDQPSFELANGQKVWDWFATHPDEAEVFATTMRTLTDFNGADLAGARHWEPGSTICDVAGGVGTLLSHVLATDSSLSGVLVDVADVIDQSAAFLEGRGVGDRVRTEVGSFFEPLDVVADSFLLKDVLHDWDDERCVAILSNVVAAMGRDSRLVLVEIVQEEWAAHGLAPYVDLTMLTQTDGGRQRTLAEFDELFARVGLRRSELHPSALHSLVVAVPDGPDPR